jgi:hypothetical protein
MRVFFSQEYYRFDPFLRKGLQNVIRREESQTSIEDSPTREYWISFYNLQKV